MSEDIEGLKGLVGNRVLRITVVNILLASIYIIAGKFGLSLAFVHASATAVWPPAGIALIVFLVYGYRVWPGIFVGAFVVNLTTAGTVITSVGIAFGNTLEGVIGAYLIAKYAGGLHALDKSKDVLKFAFLAAVVSTMVSATIGVTTLALGGFARWEDSFSIWLTWWLGDAASDLIVAPVLLLWIRNPRVGWKAKQMYEIAAFVVFLVLVSLVVFNDLFRSSVKNYPLDFIYPPVLLLIAFRFTQREAATATALLSGISIWGTLKGFGPFALDTKNESLLLLQLFMSVNAAMTLTVAAVVSGRRDALLALRKSHAELDLRVQERTGALSKAYEGLQVEMNERRHSEEKLRQSQRQLAEAQHIAHVGSWEWDLQKNVVAWSEELYHIFGLSPEGFAKTFEAFLERVYPEDREFVRAVVENAFHDHRPFNFEHRTVLPGGQEKILSCRGRVVTDEKKQVVRMFGTAQDITERKRVEQLVADSQRELREYIDHMSTLSAKVALDGTILIVNKIAEIASGIPRDKLMTTKFTEGPWWSFDPAVQTRIRDSFRRAVAGESINYDERLFAFGKVITINFSLVPVYNESGRVSYIIAEARDITPQKQAEEALRGSEERYRVLVEGAKDYAIFALDPEGNILTWNSGAENIKGYQDKEIIGKSVSLFYTSEDQQKDKPRQLLEQAKIEGKAEDEGWRVRKDGTRFWADTTISALYGSDGNLFGFTKVTRDLTDRKRKEEVIRMLGHTVTSMNDCAVITDMENNIIFVNPAFVKTYGYEEGEITGRNIAILRPVTMSKKLTEEIYRETLRGGWQGEIDNVRKNGELFPIHLSTSIIYDQKKTPIALVGICQDIAERKHAHESLRRWGQIFENAEFGIVIVGSNEETIELMNPTFARMHGYSVLEFSGKWIGEVIATEERAELSKRITAAREKGHLTFESRHTRKDGGVFPVTVDITAVKDQSRDAVYYIIHVQDITDRKRMEAQAKEAFRKEVLLKEIHHRVKNNLQIVASILSLESEHIKDKHALNAFADSQNRIKTITLIHEKLYQSRDLSKVGMDEYFESLVVNLVRSYARKPAAITTHVNVEEIYLGIDTAIPCGLIVNELVSNCLKHAFPDGQNGEIGISLHQEGDGSFRLQVSDNGIGFPKEIDFRNTSSLGLQLVDMFVQQINGTIHLNNLHGTEYSITFKEVVYAERG